ncbi:hypothetical protein BEL04_15240 [Mucilaginibacter sp. PPCGB 2223]|uniref:DUF4126 family protein n=1 Tax=Mucilaginibacter sp. PPCGB 2223 TaxID=1886027 RepID=UPI000827161D|nr:DUF4126 family protein [Mucilaginibacter sp. PPCGB 2223]OCX51382.1 hypothetical protein BEL04_15240 [Mucilaginibacter sp. PPCGB 2223]
MTKLPDYLLFKSLALASLCGSRSFAGVTSAAYLLSRNPSKTLQCSHLPFKYLQQPVVANTLAVLAIGELIGDKMPFTPNRTELLSLTGRAAGGAFTSAALLKANRGNAVTGLILGGACALASTFASFYFRKIITKPGRLSNAAGGLLEDLLVLAAGAAVICKFGDGMIK